MPSAMRVGVVGAILTTMVLSGCVVPLASPTLPSPSASQTTIGSVVVSTQPGPGVDRRHFEASSSEVEGVVPGLAGDGLEPYRVQKLSWHSCADGTRCADFLAPMDYAHPSDRAVTISVRVKPATRRPHLGSLFVNPGGPGGSGKQLVESFQTTGLEQYDIVGWDPRGTGDSTPVRCSDDGATDAFLNFDASPDNEAERAALLTATQDWARSCRASNGDLLDHIGTIETVKDLDLLRQLLGNKKLNYLGYSYGTQIGATYAELFGPNTGRLVLDGAVNITGDESVIQAQGFDLALGNFASWCATDAKKTCGLGDSADAVIATITGLFDSLDAKPIPVGDRQLTQSLAVTGVATALYGGKEAWPVLGILVQRALNGEGEALLYAADQLNDRDQDGHYGSLQYAFPAISCPETKENGVLDAERVWAEDQVKAPVFGRYFGPGYGCALWTSPPSDYLSLHLVGKDARPLVVIGNTGDNATPIEDARSMAKQLVSAVLVTYEGEGHTSYGGKSQCVDKLVVDYLVRGRVPAEGTTCR